MTEKEYLPFKTINVFIDNDYLQNMLEFLLKNLNTLSKTDQITFSNAFKEYVSILGFRNPMRAPLQLQVNALVTAFEEKDEVVPFTLSTWAKINENFAEEVETWLESEGWKDLRRDWSFEKSEGFIHEWPDDLSFDQIIKKFKEDRPNLNFDEEDLILMILWISGRLPDE